MKKDTVSKNEYYDRVIASLQSEIDSLKTICIEQGKVIEELKSTVARQQKEIDSLKASQTPARSPLYERLTGADKAHILQQAKTECENLIQTRFEILQSRYATKREIDTFRATVSKIYLPAETFTSYRKHQENRLKSIEEKLSLRFSLLTISRNIQKILSSARNSFNPADIIRSAQQLNLKWLIQILVFTSICLIATYLYSSITD